jgi:hypothetical protein
MQSSVSTASQAASSAAIVASQAATTGNSASQTASQAYSVAKAAQSAGSNATIVANNASQAASSAVLAGSQAAVSASQASADYKTLSTGVNDGSVVHITTKTVIDKGIIGTAEIANGAITNAQIGNAAVNSAKIANLAVGTAQIGNGAITNAKIGSLAVGTAQIANAAITDEKVGNVSANKITVGTIDFNTIIGKNINASNITTGTMSTDRLNVGKLSALSANLGDVTTGSLKGVDIVANSFSTPNGSFTTDSNGAVVASNLTIRGVTNLVYNAALLGDSGTYPNTKVPGWNLFTKGYYSNATLHDGVPSIGFNSSTGSGNWVTFAQSKLYPLNGLTGQPYSASVWFVDDGSEAAMKYQFTLAFFDANGNRLASGYAGNTWNGNPTSQGWAYKTINNIISPSTAVYVAIQYWAYNGTGHALFSSPMLTQTAQSTGYQPDTGNVVSAGEIDGSVINGSTINGTTINTPNLNLGDNGQIIGDYSVSDSTGWFQPINGTGTLQISHGYIRSTANILYYNKLLQGIGGDKWGHWASSTQFVPAPNQAYPDTGNIAESTFTPAFLKLDIFSADKSKVVSRTYIDGTGFYVNDGGTQAVSAMLSDYELLSSGMAYLNGGIQMKQGASFTFGNLAMTGYHTIAMLDGNALFFTDKAGGGGNPIEIVAKTFTKSSRLSIKHDITPLSTAESSRLLNAIDVEKFRYTNDSATFKYQYGGVIDDVNSLGNKQYSMPHELLSEDGTGINLDSLTGVLIKRVQDQDKMIGELSMRLTRLEMEK